MQLAIPLSKQLDNYRDYQAKVVDLVGEENATSLFSRGLYVLSAGSSDFLQNYFISPILQSTYTPNQFSEILLRNYAEFIEVFLKVSSYKISAH